MAAPAIGVRPAWRRPADANIDGSHPLAAGLAFLWDPTHNRDLVTGRLGNNPRPLTHSPWGPAASFSGSGSNPQFPLTLDTTKATTLALFRTASTAGQIIVELGPNWNTTNPAFGQYVDSATVLAATSKPGIGTDPTQGITHSGVWLAMGATHSNVIGDAVELAAFRPDGTSVVAPTSVTVGAGATGANWISNTLNIGARNASSVVFNGTIATVAVWRRWLTVSEMRLFAAQPWQIIRA